MLYSIIITGAINLQYISRIGIPRWIKVVSMYSTITIGKLPGLLSKGDLKRDRTIGMTSRSCTL